MLGVATLRLDRKDWLSHLLFQHGGRLGPRLGGETVVLDDGGRLHPRSAPPFEAFDRAFPSQSLGNRSLIFTRRGNSWHGVREIRCPEGHMRKVFIVVLNRDGLADRIRFALTRRNVTRY